MLNVFEELKKLRIEHRQYARLMRIPGAVARTGKIGCQDLRQICLPPSSGPHTVELAAHIISRGQSLLKRQERLFRSSINSIHNSEDACRVAHPYHRRMTCRGVTSTFKDAIKVRRRH
ncbi:hypothetical protein TNCV_2783231 [Trichonephila clavipes]|nr:hypothetical protein TNCV_2783231 [Trichonephila clavipes]